LGPWKARHAAEIESAAADLLKSSPGLTREQLEAKVLQSNIASIRGVQGNERKQQCGGLLRVATMPADGELVASVKPTASVPPPPEEPGDSDFKRADRIYEVDQGFEVIGAACATLMGDSGEKWKLLHDDWSRRYSDWIQLGWENSDDTGNDAYETQARLADEFQKMSPSARRNYCSDLRDEMKP
jgi:hypothetical protein